MKKKTDYMHYISIIAIVAIVAVVLLVLNKGNLAGEVSRLPSRSLPTVSSELVFVSESELNTFYNIYAGQYLAKTGDQVCREMGYRSCETAVFHTVESYYESKDATCNGHQAGYGSSNFGDCDQMPHNNDCYTQPTVLRYLEPSDGDIATRKFIFGAFCIK